MPRDEVDRGVGEHVAAIAVRLFLAAVVDQHGVKIAAARRIGRLHHAPAPMHERLGKTLVIGARRIVVAQVPFAKDAGAIAGRRKHFGQGHFVGGHRRAAQKRVDRAGAIVVPTGHQAGPGGTANRRDVEARQLDALPRQLVEVRRLNVRIAVKAEVAPALVVGHDQQDVGPGISVGGQTNADDRHATDHDPDRAPIEFNIARHESRRIARGLRSSEIACRRSDILASTGLPACRESAEKT